MEVIRGRASLLKNSNDSLLQQYLLDELENSKDNPGRTLHGEKYVEDLFLTMKAFWDQFTGGITHETTCTSTAYEDCLTPCMCLIMMWDQS